MRMMASVQAAKMIAENLHTTKEKYIWADGICINQDNIAERNVQVAMMRQIYQRANLVFCLLGEPDRYSRSGLYMCALLAEIYQNVYNDTRSWSLYDPAFWSSIGKEAPSDAQWRDWAIFMCREWFFRAWVLQEVALGKRDKVILHCGTISVLLVTVIAALELVKNKSWNDRLYQQLDPERSESAANDQVLHLYRDNIELVVGGANPIRQIGLLWNRLDSGQSISLITACTQVYHFARCSDPRDRIYSLAGIVAELQLGSSHPGLDVDYRQSPKQVYISTTRHVLARTASLDVLTLVGDRSHEQNTKRTRVDKLPSWCPDFSLPFYGPQPLLSDDSRPGWKAAGQSQHVVEFDTDECQLSVRGWNCDEIVEVANAEILTHDFSSLFDQVRILLRLAEAIAKDPKYVYFLITSAFRCN